MTSDDDREGRAVTDDEDSDAESSGYVHTPGDSQDSETESSGYVHTPGDSQDSETESSGYVHTPGDSQDSETESSGYVHTPDGTIETSGRASDRSAADSHEGGLDVDSGGNGRGVVKPADTDREFDWRGWILVGVLFVAFVVAPATIYLVPPAADSYLTVLIVVPLVPALLLAVVAVWATTRP